MVQGTGEQGGVGRQALTPQREVVLRVVQETDEHLTANEIFEAARKLLPGISFATVYNSLRFLKEAGMVGEVSFGNGATRFDRETKRHDHAICRQCGRLVDFSLPATVQLMRAAARRTRFKPESISLTLTGLCAECRAEEEGAPGVAPSR